MNRHAKRGEMGGVITIASRLSGEHRSLQMALCDGEGYPGRSSLLTRKRPSSVGYTDLHTTCLRNMLSPYP